MRHPSTGRRTTVYLRCGTMLASRLLTALLAPTGVLAAHALAYGAIHGWGHERQAMLTGHGPFAALAAVALPLALAALLVVAVTPPTAGRPRLRQQAVVQVTTFVAALFVERVLAVEPLVEVLHDPATWLAAAGQVATAAVVVALVRVADRRLRHCDAPPSVGRTVPIGHAWVPSGGQQVRPRWSRGVVGPRAPPAGVEMPVRS